MTKNLHRLKALRIGDHAVLGLLLLSFPVCSAVTRVCVRPLTGRLGSGLESLVCLPVPESRNRSLGCCCGGAASPGRKQDAWTGRPVMDLSCKVFCIAQVASKCCGQDRASRRYAPRQLPLALDVRLVCTVCMPEMVKAAIKRHKCER